MINTSVKGLDEVLKKMGILPERIQKNVMTGAVRAGAKPVTKEMKRLVSVDEGALKKSIGAVKRRSKDKSITWFTIAPRSKKGGWIAHFIEFGTSKMSASPFARPALEKEWENTVKAAQEYVFKRIPKEVSKL